MTSRMALGLCLVLLAGPLHGQSLRGRLVDEDTREPIAGGELALLSADSTGIASVLSDSAGQFAVDVPEPGAYRLRAARIGYRTAVSQPLELAEGDTVEVEYRLSVDAVLLNPIEVVAESRRVYPGLAGFYARADRSVAGRFVTREEIERRMPQLVTDLLRVLPGVQLVPARRGTGNHILMRGGCLAAVYLDGVHVALAGSTVDDLVRPTDLEGIEVYRSVVEVPGEYWRPNTSCGAVLIWTRRGP